MPVPLLVVAGAVTATTLAGVFGWKARGAADEITGEVTAANGAVNTVQLVLLIAALYAGYRFVKGFK